MTVNWAKNPEEVDGRERDPPGRQRRKGEVFVSVRKTNARRCR